jgi:phosphoribosylformylglycinamidine synthase
LIQLPIAHAEGKFIMDKKDLAALKKNEQIVFQYVNTKGNLAGYPFNPNGSMESIAAITDKTGLVLGIMPHPERFIRKYQHPHWQRLKKKKLKGDGNLIFKNGIDYVKNNLIKNR